MKRYVLFLVILAVTVNPILAYGACNDDYFYTQYYIQQLDIDDAWDMGYNGKGVKIAVLDSGIKYDCNDIDYSRIKNVTNCTSSKSEYDNYGHGHGIIGLIGAKKDNGYGTAGILSKVTIIPIKILDNKGNGKESDFIQGMQRAIDLKVDVISLSCSCKSYSKEEQAIINKAASKDIIIVASAGNTGTKGKRYPGDYKNVIKVGVSTKSGKFSKMSSWKHNDCMAPGIDIVVENKKNTYYYCNGSSYSCPIVACLACMCKQVDKSIDHDDFMKILKHSSSNDGEKRTKSGYGLINYKKALRYAERHW